MNIYLYLFFIIKQVLQLLVLRPGIVHQEADAPSLVTLLKDRYIVVAAGKCKLFPSCVAKTVLSHIDNSFSSNLVLNRLVCKITDVKQ